MHITTINTLKRDKKRQLTLESYITSITLFTRDTIPNWFESQKVKYLKEQQKCLIIRYKNS